MSTPGVSSFGRDETPEGLEHRDLGSTVTISWRWFERSDLVNLPLNAVLGLLSLGRLVIAPLSLRGMMNRTTIEVSADRLSVQTGPVGRTNWSLRRPFDIAHLGVRRTKSAAWGVLSLSFEVYAVTNEDQEAVTNEDQEEVVIAEYVPTEEQARYIATQLEQFLDYPVIRYDIVHDAPGPAPEALAPEAADKSTVETSSNVFPDIEAGN